MTLKKTWDECLRMWKWIVEQNPISVEAVWGLKKEWIKDNEYEHKSIWGWCFFCAYNKNFDGIRIKGRSNIEIRNGTVTRDNRPNYKGFRNGIYATTEWDAEPIERSNSIRIIDVRITDCRENGIYLEGNNQRIKDCTISDIGTPGSVEAVRGIFITGNGSSIVSGCIVNNNGAQSAGGVSGIHVVA